MLPMFANSDRANFSVEAGSFRKLAEVFRIACESKLQGCGEQISKRLTRIVAVAPLFLLLFTCGGIASAQPAPDSVIAAALGPSAVKVTFTACASSDQESCKLGFWIYRNPPGFTSLLGNAQLGQGTYVGSSQTIYMDTKVTGGQSYTYRVCTAGPPNSDGSNCTTTNSPVKVPVGAPPTPPPTVKLNAQNTTIPQGTTTTLNWTSTNATSLDLEPGKGKVPVPTGSTAVGPGTYTITAYGSGGGKAVDSVTINVPCPIRWSPPSKMSALVGEDIHLTWTNPNTNAEQICPAPSTEVLIYRMGTNGWEQLATLDKKANGGILPTHYTDSGLFQPHTGYQYLLCEGGIPNWQNASNCASPPGAQHDGDFFGIITWGANPVLSATRVNANAVKLQIALDQYTVSSVVVTRQGSDDPCRQGGTLGNGLQGCPTPTIGSNGVKVNSANNVTVYSWTQSGGSLPPGFQNSQVAPFIIDLPNDTTVKPGVEYYYLAQVVWDWSVEQDSNTVTVPNAYASATLQQVAGGAKPIKLNGNAPPPPSQSKSAATSAVSPTSHTMTPASSSMMRPAGSMSAPPQQATAARPMMSPMMSPAPPMLQPGQPTTSSTGSSSSPLLAQPGTAARPAIAPVKAATSARTANLSASIKQVQQKPHDPQALYTLGKAYCASSLKNTGVSYMYMALLLAEQAGNVPLTTQIKASLAQQGVNTK